MGGNALSPTRRAGLTLDPAARPRRLGLTIAAGLRYGTWQRIGRQLSSITGSSAWWLGDWLVYGEAAYPDRYLVAVRETELHHQTLRNYAWVARRFALPRRRESLTFQHHAEVCALPPAEQDLWLDRAEGHGWSRNELRRQIRTGNGRPAGTPAEVRLRLPIRQEQACRRAAELTHDGDLDAWIIAALDRAARTVVERAQTLQRSA
ncbi:LmbU family transcriptional regulator [Actinoplanes sp. NPDC026619]|uniref:LmbU family transcriptional regulator n=1 Tax=Actinoplanes sp. NPDC026619 TaxID=3155798 RepID=UPI0033CB1A0E